MHYEKAGDIKWMNIRKAKDIKKIATWSTDSDPYLYAVVLTGMTYVGR